MSAAADHVFVLRTTREQSAATKRFCWSTASQTWVKTAYGMGTRFIPSRHFVTCIKDLGELVERTRRDPQSFIIRAELASGRQLGAPVNRRYLVRPDKAAPDFVDAARSWLMADIDGWEIPDGFDLVDDIDLLVERAIGELLPPEFHDVEAFWQLSSSAGFAPGTLKVHVWFYLDRPIETTLLKCWMLINASGIDQALFNPVQIHYTADPIIEGGPDPIPQRTGWVQGERDVVTLPDLNAADLADRAQQRHRDAATASGLSPSQAATIEGALAALGDGEGLAGFHEPLRRAAWLYAAKTPPWQRVLGDLKHRMREAIQTAPINRKIRSGVSDYLLDDYLDRLILGAFDKMPEGGGWEACKPEHFLPTGGVEASRDRMQTAIRAFLQQPAKPPSGFAAAFNPGPLASVPRRGLVVAEVGLGKTEVTLRAIAEFISREKAAGRPSRVAYVVPEHRLGAELVSRAAAHGIVTAAWHGRKYIDRETKVAMCDDPKAVELAENSGANVAKFVCGSHLNPDKPLCPFYADCRYQNQRPIAVAADMVVAAHATLFNKLPDEISTDLGLVVIDESFWQTGLRQSSITVETFSRDAVDHPVLRRNALKEQVIDETGTNDLHSLRAKVQTALEASPLGYMQKQHIEAAGLTADDCALAGQLEWQRQRDIPMWPGMPMAERVAAYTAVAINAQLPRMHAFWTTLRELLESGDESTGRIDLEQQEGKGGSQRVAKLNSRQTIATAALECPILLLDGTGDMDIVRHFLPTLEMLAEERPHQPHVTIRQVVGALSKTSLAKRTGLVAELRDFVALTTGGEAGLIITHLDLEEAFNNIPNVQVAHFGAISGRDEWKNVRHLITIGRPQPKPEHAKAMAAQLTGIPVPLADPVRATRGVLLTDGTGIGIEVSRFDNPDAEAIRAAVTDAAIVQACGRGRGPNRTASTPLDLWVIGNVITPWPIAELRQWGDVAPGPIARMVSRDGVALTSATDASRIYPDVFPTAEAARKAMHRCGWKGDFPDIPLYILYYKGMSGKWVKYRPEGRGQQSRTAFVAAKMLSSLQGWLEARLGALANYEVVGEPPPNDAPCFTCEMEPSAMPGITLTDRDQRGLSPSAVYSRGILEPPNADQWSIQMPDDLPIVIRSRPGALTQQPRCALVWPGRPPAVRFVPDCSRSALLTEAQSDIRRMMFEPRN